MKNLGHLWGCRPITLVLRMKRQEDFKIKASLGYTEDGAELHPLRR